MKTGDIYFAIWNDIQSTRLRNTYPVPSGSGHHDYKHQESMFTQSGKSEPR